MTSVTLVNSLSGLLILTSLLVIEVKQSRMSAMMYSIQSIVLVLIFLVLAYYNRRRTALLVGSQRVCDQSDPGASDPLPRRSARRRKPKCPAMLSDQRSPSSWQPWRSSSLLYRRRPDPTQSRRAVQTGTGRYRWRTSSLANCAS